eukprot:6176043-Pleurochrysis_carterae.AAC.4
MHLAIAVMLARLAWHACPRVALRSLSTAIAKNLSSYSSPQSWRDVPDQEQIVTRHKDAQPDRPACQPGMQN